MGILAVFAYGAQTERVQYRQTLKSNMIIVCSLRHSKTCTGSRKHFAFSFVQLQGLCCMCTILLSFSSSNKIQLHFTNFKGVHARGTCHLAVDQQSMKLWKHCARQCLMLHVVFRRLGGRWHCIRWMLFQQQVGQHTRLKYFSCCAMFDVEQHAHSSLWGAFINMG